MEAMFNLNNISGAISDSSNAKAYQHAGGNIEFKDVHFKYNSKTDRPILKGINMTIPAGRTVAIVGSSGSGKSTLLRLLYRFYDFHQGTITIDNQDIKNLKLTTLREKIAIVSQDNALFNETLGYNIAYGTCSPSQPLCYSLISSKNIFTGNIKAASKSPNIIMEAAKLAKLDALIQRLPEGLNTRVGERGLKLSGGEKQRVAIARCFLKNCPIILLDEATSSLDTETEQAVQESIHQLASNSKDGNANGRTVIIIAHRLSTVQSADKIIVIEDGAVVEEGNHEDLIKKGGRYNELVMKMT